MRRLTSIARVVAVLAAMARSTLACGDPDEAAQPPLEQQQVSAPAPPPPSVEPAPPGAPRVECASGAAIETEPNDAPGQATAFTDLSFCGVLATSKDVDYSTFEVPAGMKLTTFQAVIEGKVDFEITANGSTFGPGDVGSFGTGKHVVKAFTTGDRPCTYRYRIVFEPE